MRAAVLEPLHLSISLSICLNHSLLKQTTVSPWKYLIQGFLLIQKNLITSILYSTMRLPYNNLYPPAREQSSYDKDFI